MHIVQLIDLLHEGGAQKLLITFAGEVKRREDVDLTVVSLQADAEGPVAHALCELGVQVHAFPARRLADPLRFRRLLAYFREHQVDVMHAHLNHAIILGGAISRITRTPMVASLHNIAEGLSELRPRKRFAETVALRFGADRVVAVGDLVQQTHANRLRHQTVECIPNAVPWLPELPASRREALRTELAGHASRPVLIAVGRLVPQKGYPDLLEAFAVIRHRFPSALLLIVGDGPQRDELQALCTSLGLDESVRLLGTRNDVADLLAASDLFVSASLWEGLPIALLEAMAAGLPVVSTAVGDVPNVLVEGTGIAVPPREPGVFAAEVCGLLEDPGRKERLAAAGKAHVRTRYAATQWVDRLMDLYAGVLTVPKQHAATGGPEYK